MICSGLTCLAATTRGARLDGNAVAGLALGDCRADGVDGAGRFMAHYEASPGTYVLSYPAVVPEMDLRWLLGSWCEVKRGRHTSLPQTPT
jgi:hypothetical protein